MMDDFLEFRSAVEFKANKLFKQFEPVYFIEEEAVESDLAEKEINKLSTDKMGVLLL
jgi:hypothetical protein